MLRIGERYILLDDIAGYEIKNSNEVTIYTKGGGSYPIRGKRKDIEEFAAAAEQLYLCFDLRTKADYAMSSVKLKALAEQTGFCLHCGNFHERRPPGDDDHPHGGDGPDDSPDDLPDDVLKFLKNKIVIA